MTDKPTIFVFCNSCAPEWHSAVALAEDGTCITGHVCSSHGWIIHDMGLSGDWKHEHYDAHYPDGWQLEYVHVTDIAGHAALQQALAANKAKRAGADAAPEQS